MNSKFNTTINWRFKLLVSCGIFFISFLLFRYLFESNLEFSLSISAFLGLFQGFTISAGIDNFYVKKHFKNHQFQTTAYLLVNKFFFIPGKLIVSDNSLIFVTHKINMKQNIIKFHLEDISILKKTNFIGLFKLGLKLKTKSGQQFYFLTSKQDTLIKHFHTTSK